MTPGRHLDIFDFDEEEESSDVDDETIGQIDDQIKHPLGGNDSENFSTHSTITIHSTTSLAIPGEMKDIPWELEDLEIPLNHMRTIIERTMQCNVEVGGDGCQEASHNLKTCTHQTDWNSCQVNMQTLLSPIWQTDNPWVNPAWLFKELNRVMKIRLEEAAEKLKDITTDLIILTESNAMVNRCNEGIFFQMKQDEDKYEKQLQDISKQVNIFIGELYKILSIIYISISS